MPGNTWARFEDIDVEANEWNKDVEFFDVNKHVKRMKGQSCGNSFNSWKKFVKDQGQEALDGFYLWMQPNASQDTLLGHWHSDLVAKESPDGALCQVDCFIGEFAESVERCKFVLNQANVNCRIRFN